MTEKETWNFKFIPQSELSPAHVCSRPPPARPLPTAADALLHANHKVRLFHPRSLVLFMCGRIKRIVSWSHQAHGALLYQKVTLLVSPFKAYRSRDAPTV